MNPPDLLVVRCDRDRSGHGPHEARQLTGNRPGDHVGVCSSCDESSVACTAPDLGCPPAILADCGWCFESPLPLSAHLGWIALRPGAFDQSPSGLGVAGFGHGPLPALRTRGLVRGHQAQAFHQCSWMINTRAIANG